MMTAKPAETVTGSQELGPPLAHCGAGSRWWEPWMQPHNPGGF